jgi:hypothetical protein
MPARHGHPAGAGRARGAWSRRSLRRAPAARASSFELEHLGTWCRQGSARMLRTPALATRDQKRPWPPARRRWTGLRSAAGVSCFLFRQGAERRALSSGVPERPRAGPPSARLQGSGAPLVARSERSARRHASATLLAPRPSVLELKEECASGPERAERAARPGAPCRPCTVAMGRSHPCHPGSKRKKARRCRRAPRPSSWWCRSELSVLNHRPRAP